MKKHPILLALLFSLISLASYSADTLRVELIGNDTFTVVEGGTFNFTLRLNNDSAYVFAGTVGFAYTIQHPLDTTSYNDTSTSNGGLAFLIETLSIAPNTFQDKNFTGYVNAPRFKTGPTVVIIWPIVTSNNIDSLVGNKVSLFVQVDALAGSGNGLDKEKLRIFKRDEELLIQHLPGTIINRVRIVDVLGREVWDKTYPADNIPLPVGSTGIYIAEVTFNNNQRQVFRFYR